MVQTIAAYLCFPGERSHNLDAATSEGAMNSLAHAGGGSMTVCADPDGTEVQVWIRDDGKGTSTEHLHRTTMECGFTTPDSMGCGFFIILNTVDMVSLLTDAMGTTLVLTQKREMNRSRTPVGFFRWLPRRDKRDAGLAKRNSLPI